MTSDLTELRAAIVEAREAQARVNELRRDIIARDLPRPWVFSHSRISGSVQDQPSRSGFITVDSTLAEVDEKLREAVRALPFETCDGPLDVTASASCHETGEYIEVSVHLSQAVPDCVRPSGHEWTAVLLDEHAPEGYPGGRRLMEGCPHCDGRRTMLWPQVTAPAVITYDAPHHYPEGSVRRRLAS